MTPVDANVCNILHKSDHAPRKPARAFSSMSAMGAEVVGQVQPKAWSVPSRPRGSQAVFGKAKVKWQL